METKEYVKSTVNKIIRIFSSVNDIQEMKFIGTVKQNIRIQCTAMYLLWLASWNTARINFTRSPEFAEATTAPAAILTR